MGRTVCAYAALKVGDLSECWVLAACAQEVAEGGAVDASISALVEELECLAVVCGGLGGVIHCCSLNATVCGMEGCGVKDEVAQVNQVR